MFLAKLPKKTISEAVIPANVKKVTKNPNIFDADNKLSPFIPEPNIPEDIKLKAIIIPIKVAALLIKAETTT